MPISDLDTFAVAWSPSELRAAEVFDGSEVIKLIDKVKAILLACGWTKEEDLKAQGDLYLPGWTVGYKPIVFDGVEFINDTCGGCGNFGTHGECMLDGMFAGTLESLAG